MADAGHSSIMEVQPASDNVIRVPDRNVQRMRHANQDIAKEASDASKATHREHTLTLRDSLRLYPKAIAFSLIFSTAVIMEGYDLSLMGSFYGFAPFKDRFGDQPDPTGGKVISAKWQTSIQNSGQCGQIVGIYLNGWISDRIGYKKTLLGSLVLMIATIFVPFFAQNVQTFLVGQVLQGIPWGVFQTLTVTYASDVAPVVLRPYLTTYVNLCWVIGQFLAAGILRGFLERDDQWAYRIPFAIQWIWPPLIIAGAIFAPESPWWLVRKGRFEDARKSLLALSSRNSGVDFDVDEQLAMIKATNELEIAVSEGTNYWDCFTGTDLRRTETACVSYLTQTFCGTALMGYSVQFYERAGLSSTNAFNMNLGQTGMGVVGTCVSWYLMSLMGRRTIYLYGVSTLTVILIVVGALGFTDSIGASWAIGTLLLIYTFVYDLTAGPVCYSLVAEMPSSRLKNKTVVLARNFGNIGGFINNALMPNMLGVNSWNWGAKTGLFWAGLCLLFVLWSYFRLPEPKGRTYGEMDLLFEHRISARKFATTKVDQFSSQTASLVAKNEFDTVEVDHKN